jgi:myo-inositol-1(or 4)-monophosphatase
MMPLEEICRFVIEVALKTGAYIRERQKELKQEDIAHKGESDLVTIVDKRAEEILVDALGIILPEAGFFTEEKTVSQEEKEYMWVIDPIDGTTNFVHGIPHYSISIALQKNHETLFGLVYEITHDECFYAIKNSGAFMNGQPIRVSNNTQLMDCALATGFPPAKFELLEQYLQSMRVLLPACRTIRRMGSAAVDLAYVACGRFDGFFEYGLHAWDIAAGALLVAEAGGTITDFKGDKNYQASREIVATNSKIDTDLTTIIKTSFYGD